MNLGISAEINTKNTGFIKHMRKNLLAWLMLLPSLIIFLIFVWQPLVSGVILSFFETIGFKAGKFVGFQNFIDVMSDPTFVKAFTNCLSYTLWSFLIGFLLPIVVAIAINEMVNLNSFFRFSVFFPSMIPGIATAIMWFFIFDPGDGGLLNMLFTRVGLPQSQWLQNEQLTIPLIIITLTWRAFGGTTIIYLAGLQGVNQELYEASTLDGAGVWGKIRHITLPGISNIIGLMFIMQIIGVFQIMAEPLAMTDGGPNNASVSLILQAYRYAFKDDNAVGKSMAVGTITFIILMIFTFIYFRINKNMEAE